MMILSQVKISLNCRSYENQTKCNYLKKEKKKNVFNKKLNTINKKINKYVNK